MRKKMLYAILAAVIVLGSLTACELPASRAPDGQSGNPTPTSEIFIPTPKATEDSISVIMTMTAMAQATPLPPLATPTPQVVDTTKTPKPKKTATPEIVQPQVTWVPTPGLPTSYTLQAGEFPYCIARRFNLDVAAFQTLNPGTNFASGLFDPGLSLKIPQGTTWNAGPRALKGHPTTYTVQSGDTIYIVACKFGDVDPDGIIAVNGLESPFKLKAGNTIQIP